jgi:hypothetical protein
MGMGVTYRDDGVPAIQVQIFLPLVIPNFTSFALNNVHVEERIYIK